MSTAQVAFEEVVLPEVTSRKYVLHMPGFSPLFFLTIEVQNVVPKYPWLPEGTKGHVTPKGFPSVRACAIGSCAISALVGLFHG